MQVSGVTKQDAKQCATLIQALNRGQFTLSGREVKAFTEAGEWLSSVALQMANLLTESATDKPTGTGLSNVKISSPVPSKPSKAKKGKKK